MSRRNKIPMSAEPILFNLPVKRPTRVSEPFHLRVRGRDWAGNQFKLYAVIDNIGAGGLYLRLPHAVMTGAKLCVIVRFSTQRFDDAGSVSCLAATGTVLRAERQADGRCGVALKFSRYRFI